MSQSVMVGLLGVSSRGSIAQACIFLGGSLPARTNGGFKNCYRLFSTFLSSFGYNNSFLTRSFSCSFPRLFLPELIKSLTKETTFELNHVKVPCTFYVPIDAYVIKDRNPKGKFKLSPKHKGIVTIIISATSIIHPNTALYSENLLEVMARQAFIYNLEDNKIYYLQILVRIGKHNINITQYYEAQFLYLQNKFPKQNFSVDLSSFHATKEELSNPEIFRRI